EPSIGATSDARSRISNMPVLSPPKRATLADLKVALKGAWSAATSADPANWSERNPAWGQCAVTALVIQDYLGGELRRGEVGGMSHYWNVLPCGEEIALTRHQFDAGITLTGEAGRTRAYVLSYPATARRYERLRDAVGRHLISDACRD